MSAVSCARLVLYASTVAPSSARISLNEVESWPSSSPVISSIAGVVVSAVTVRSPRANVHAGAKGGDVLGAQPTHALDEAARRPAHRAADQPGHDGGEQDRDGEHDHERALAARGGSGRRVALGVGVGGDELDEVVARLLALEGRQGRLEVVVARPVALLRVRDRLGAGAIECLGVRGGELRPNGVSALDRRTRLLGVEQAAEALHRLHVLAAQTLDRRGDLVLLRDVAVVDVEMLGEEQADPLEPALERRAQLERDDILLLDGGGALPGGAERAMIAIARISAPKPIARRTLIRRSLKRDM
jgi:hypothetical protein